MHGGKVAHAFEQTVCDARRTARTAGDLFGRPVLYGDAERLCRVVEGLAEERRDVLFGKVDVDEEEALARRFNVLSIPTFIVLKKGEVVARTAGVRPKSALEGLL